MPRLSPHLLKHARRIDPLLCLLLRPCRDISSARNELRWLKEHALSVVKSGHTKRKFSGWRTLLSNFCTERARGKPLQYILGNQPFGDLEILCRPGVLIPRYETESYVMHLANELSKEDNATREIRILDLCTGTGCIPLLLQSLLFKKFSRLRILGVDISPKAIRLSQDNLEWNVKQGHLDPTAQAQVSFLQGDVFAPHNGDFQAMFKAEENSPSDTWDFVISNPPYISPDGFDKNTSGSVRNYEPRLALVPCHGKTNSQNEDDKGDLVGDLFYPRLYEIAERVGARGVLFEIGDRGQAFRVAQHACVSGNWTRVEVWKDFPDEGISSAHDIPQCEDVYGSQVVVRGQGNYRAVYCRR